MQKNKIIPPLLAKGDTIGIMCPSGFLHAEDITPTIHLLKSAGFNIIIGNTINSSSTNYFSGTDDERLQDLQNMLDNPNIKCILMGRGGYGLSHILDKIKWHNFLASPKWIAGFSDITLLHLHLNQILNVASIHSPMARCFAKKDTNKIYFERFLNTITHKKNALTYTFSPHQYNNVGVCEAEIIGGNLTLIAHSIGTIAIENLKNKILLLEDVGEYLYNIDRMLWQLKRAGVLQHLKGIILGSFTELKDTTRPFGCDIDTLLKNIFSEYAYPIAFNAPIGHISHNTPILLGVKHTLEIKKDEVKLTQIET